MTTDYEFALKIKNSLEEKFENLTIEFKYQFNEATHTIKKENLLNTLIFLKDHNEFSFDFLTDLTAVDYLANKGFFEIIYLLYSFKNNVRYRIKIRVEENEEADSIVNIYPTANWQEREVYDLFGIKFKNHPNLKRILMWEGYEHHPLRKDFTFAPDIPYCEKRGKELGDWQENENLIVINKKNRTEKNE